MPLLRHHYFLHRARALIVFLPAALVAGFVVAPLPAAQAFGVWTVDNFSSEALAVTASRNVDRQQGITELAAGRRWALMSSGASPSLTLSAETLGSVVLSLNDPTSSCRYYNAAGVEVAPATAGLHCLLDDGKRVRIARTTPGATTVRRVGLAMSSVQAAWVVPRVTPGQCAAATTVANPSPWLAIEISMKGGRKSYLLGTLTTCVRGQPEIVLWHSAGSHYNPVVDTRLRGGMEVRANIRYLGGAENQYRLGATLRDPVAGTERAIQITAADTPSGETRAAVLDAQPENLCWTTCTTNNAGLDIRPATPPTLAAWTITTDPVGPLTFSGEMPVTVRINQASPLIQPQVPEVQRADLLAGINSADGGRFVYPLTAVRNRPDEPYGLSLAALTVGGAFAQ